MTTTPQKVIVALSGGVDSAVAALLLCRQGYDVEALHMTNWEDDDGYCTAALDFQDARSVCRELGIPLHRANFSQAYREQVFDKFLAEYRAGRTPNPDVLCNREIKFGLFLEHARRLGAQRIATGHYARLDTGSPPHLLRGLDSNKDQSYFLHAVPAAALAHALFPVGELEKHDVRALATAAGLPVHTKRDSTGICFVGERPFREFLQRYLSAPAGAMQTPAGEVVGRHDGLMYYTRGQRQGLGIGGRAGHGDDAWYVAGKDTARNVLIVVQGRDDAALWDRELVTEAPVWITGEPDALASGAAFECTAKTRYRQRDAACTVTRLAGGLHLCFDEPQWAITRGQSAVLYRGDICLGGAVIAQAGASPAAVPVTAAAAG
ncbi:MAG: tRNA 2-thiouridine(34) synthase MnmA [Chromatiales bacterium]|nr:MAG: tRNA 2-thiouridine(34) synthase MnmA [Chromatiales bacterium]